MGTSPKIVPILESKSASTVKKQDIAVRTVQNHASLLTGPRLCAAAVESVRNSIAREHDDEANF